MQRHATLKIILQTQKIHNANLKVLNIKHVLNKQTKKKHFYKKVMSKIFVLKGISVNKLTYKLSYLILKKYSII